MSRTSRPSTRPTGRRALVLLGVGSLLLFLGHQAAARVTTAAWPALVATPTVDPGLILRPRSIPVTGVLSNGLRLSGADYPAYPGRNVLNLAVRSGGTVLMRGARIALSVTMPGMAMAPIRATLTASGRGYRGAFTLPMFGTYRVAVVVNAPHTRASGITTVTLPLPGRQ